MFIVIHKEKDIPLSSYVEKCYVQSFGIGVNKALFMVDPTISVANYKDMSNGNIALLQCMETTVFSKSSHNGSNNHVDYSVMHSFLHATLWLHHLKTVDKKDLKLLFATAVASTKNASATNNSTTTLKQGANKVGNVDYLVVENVEKAVHAYFTNIQDVIPNTDYHLLCKIMSHDNTVSQHKFHFKILQHQKSVNRYAMCLSNFVNYIIKYNHHFSQLASLQKFPLDVDMTKKLSVFVGKINNGNKHNVSKDDDILKDLHAFLMTTVSSVISPYENCYKNPILQYIVYKNTDCEKTFNLTNVMQDISMMKYAIRSVILHEILTTKKQDALKYSCINNDHMFKTLWSVQNIARGINDQGNKNIRIIWPDNNNFKTLCIDNKVVEISDLKKLYWKGYNKVKAMIQFGGLKVDNVINILELVNVDILYDDLPNTKVGYAFYNNTSNNIYNRSTLLKYIVSTEETREYFTTVDKKDSTKTVWIEESMRQWLNQAQHILELLLLLIHVSSGQPARGSELATVQLCNSETCLRSVFIVNKRVMLIQTYNKTRNMINAPDKVARFLPKSLSQLVVTYLYYIRPMEIFVVSQLYGEMAKIEMETYLFVRAKQKCFRYDGDLVCDVFKDTYLDIDARLSLNIQQYRHVSTGFSEKLITNNDTTCHGDMLINNLVQQQAGHTAKTAANIYALSNMDMRNIDRDVLRLYEDASIKWHELIGYEFENSIEQPANENSVEESCERKVPGQRIQNQQVGNVTNRNAVNVNTQVEHQIIKTTVIEYKKYVETASTLVFDNTDIVLAVEGMKKLYGQDAVFKSMAQSRAVTAVCQGIKDLLINLPTGAGKSLCIFATVKSLQSGTIVVVTPLAALMNDLCAKAVLFKIRYCVWTNTTLSKDSPSLVFVSVENANSTKLYRVFGTNANAWVIETLYHRRSTFSDHVGIQIVNELF